MVLKYPLFFIKRCFKVCICGIQDGGIVLKNGG